MLTNFTSLLAASTQAPTVALPPPTTLENDSISLSFATRPTIASSVSQYSLPTSVAATHTSHGNNAPASTFGPAYTVSPTIDVTESLQPALPEGLPPQASPGIGFCVVCRAGQSSRVACGGSRRLAAPVDPPDDLPQDPDADQSMEGVDEHGDSGHVPNKLDANMGGHNDGQEWVARTKAVMSGWLQMLYEVKHWGDVCLTCLELLWKMKVLAPEIYRRMSAPGRGSRKSVADIV